MGNITFEEDNSGKQTISRVNKHGQDALVNTASLLQLSPEDLHTALTSRVMTTTRGGAMGTVYQVSSIYTTTEYTETLLIGTTVDSVNRNTDKGNIG